MGQTSQNQVKEVKLTKKKWDDRLEQYLTTSRRKLSGKKIGDPNVDQTSQNWIQI